MSDEGSSECLATLDDPRIRLTTEPSASGAVGNWTAASRAATGPYVKLICQGDLMHPDTIAWQAADLEANAADLEANAADLEANTEAAVAADRSDTFDET